MPKLDLIIVTLSACYLAILPVGLPHLIFGIGTIYLLLKAATGMVSINTLWFFVFIAFGLFQLYVGADWKAMVNNVSSMALFPVVYEVLRNRSKNRLIEIGVKFVKFTIVILCIEAVIRYSLGTVAPIQTGWYRYKFYSFMFQDTNFAALVHLVVVFFTKYLMQFHNQKQLKKYYIIGIVLLFMSVSRAAWVAWFIGEIMFWKLDPIKYVKQISFRFLCLAGFGAIFGTAIFLWLYEDPSFKSKLYILELAETIYDELDSIKYIGAGYNNSEKVLGIYAHNAIFLYFIDTGALGLLLKIVLLLYIMIKSRWQALIVFFPFIIAAQSAIGYGVHYLYAIFALITLIANSNSQTNEHQLRNN